MRSIPMVARAGFVRVLAGDAYGDAGDAADWMAVGSDRISPPDPGLYGGVRRALRFVVGADAESVAFVRRFSPARSGGAGDFGGAARESDLSVVHRAARAGAGIGDERHGVGRRHLA